MKEDIQKLISHYQVELIKEGITKEKQELIETFVKQLSEIIETKDAVPMKNKGKKQKRNQKKQEFMRNPMEVELVQKKKGIENYGF